MEVTGYRIKIGEVEVIVTRTQLIELQAQIQQLIGPMPMPTVPQPPYWRNPNLDSSWPDRPFWQSPIISKALGS